MIQISLNGHLQDIPEHLSLGELLKQLRVNPLQVAVSKNMEVVVRSELEQTFLSEGDEVEIFHAVGGG